MAYRIGRKTITTPEDVERLKVLYNKNVPMNQIVEKLGLSKTWVCDTCRRLIQKGELEVREKTTKDAIRRKSEEIPFKEFVDTGKIFALWHAGWTTEEIANEMTLNQKQVIQVLDSEV